MRLSIDYGQHPDTGQTLVGARFPQWPQAMALGLAAAVHFPGLRLQHWDVAFCSSGPVLMESHQLGALAGGGLALFWLLFGLIRARQATKLVP